MRSIVRDAASMACSMVVVSSAVIVAHVGVCLKGRQCRISVGDTHEAARFRFFFFGE
jgi:hypothetical protein